MKILSKILILIWILTACAPQVTEEKPNPTDASYPNPSYPNPAYPNPSYPNVDSSVSSPAQEAAITHLSRTLNLPADQIALISVEAVTWSDGCLGVQRPGVMCTQALVEGYRIILEADGRQYEVRSNESGSQVVIASGMETGSLIESALIGQLADNLGLNAREITVLSDESVEFPDTCLGVAMPEAMCAEVITPGRVVVLEANGVQYEYHVSADGSRVQPATFALTWARDGGIAGFCDRLTVFLSGEVYGNRCNAQEDERMGTFANLLTADQREQFDDWTARYGQITIDASDPKDVSDRMTVMLTFFGTGSRTSALSSDSQGMMEFAQALYRKLYE